jgi:5-methyltetrahydrofolate--homocysteine methyltransferase
MYKESETAMQSRFLDTLRQRVLVFDGAMGTSIHALHLPLDDYDGQENCNEILVLSRPDAVRRVHESFLSVGCDAVETNTFGGSKLTLGEFGLQDRTREINRTAAQIAREACDAFSSADKPRFVIGSIGPGTKLISLGQVDWDRMLDGYQEQIRGLLEGGSDALIIETCQDILQAKCAIVAAQDVMAELDRAVPIICTFTVETTGTLLIGTETAAALTALEAYDSVHGIGINCATGPQEMSEHVRLVTAATDRFVAVQPNAGLPQVVDGQTRYTLAPDELARWLLEFVEADGVNIVGGCCGTTPEHLARVVEAVGNRPPKRREPQSEPSVSSIYQAVPIRQENAVLSVGERTNANGSKKFRELLAAGDVESFGRLISVHHDGDRVKRNPSAAGDGGT